MRGRRLIYGLLIALLIFMVGLEKPPVSAGSSQAAALQITLNPAVDAYVYLGSPAANFGSAAGLYVGAESRSAVYRALFAFNLDAIPSGSTIISADFKAYVTQSSVGLTALDVALKQLSKGWAENTVTWNNQPSFMDIDQVNGVGILPGYALWDVKDLVQEWVNGKANYGLALVSSSEDLVGWRVFSSREGSSGSLAQLVISYNLPADSKAMP